MKADLHAHTIESDGRLTREALFKKAKEKGLDYLAITDHDVCRHVEDNRRLARLYGIGYLPGIELSTLHEGRSVHILGYFRDDSYASEAMESYYETIRKGREERAKQFIENLSRFYDISITYEAVHGHSDGIIARPHIARAIIERYPQYTKDETFEKFLGEHTRAYVPSTELSTAAGLKLLRRFDILTVLAHPGLIKEDVRKRVLEYEYDGLEAIYPLHDEKTEAHYRRLAKSRGMLVSAGSDYHGIDGDSSHGELGDVVLEGEDLERFLSAMHVRTNR